MASARRQHRLIIVSLKARRFLSCVSSSCRLLSRSEEGSQERSELFCSRGVHRSAAKTLDGRRSEGSVFALYFNRKDLGVEVVE